MFEIFKTFQFFSNEKINEVFVVNYISESNKHIEDYFDYYLDSNNKKLNYAVFLNGAWGSGKTWFIKKYIEKIERLDREIIYISLNGVKDVGQLNTLMLAEIYPLINGSMTKSMAKGFGGLLKGLKIDLTSFKAEDFLKLKPSTIFIFDDLERCKIDIDELFGHINNLVEHVGAKTILIADESKIKNLKYSDIKEKLVDATFIYTEESLVAIDSILNEISDEVLKNLLISNKNNILNIFNLSDYNNLRSLKQTIFSFEHFYKESFFKRNNIFDENIFIKVLEIYIILSLEYKKGNFKGGILDFTIDPDFYKEKSIGEKILGRSKGINSKEESDFYSKYNLSTSDFIFDKKIWDDLLLKRILDENLINKELDDKYFRTEIEKPVWFQLMDFYDMEESDFDILIEQAKSKLEKEDFENWEDVIHTFSMLVYFKNISVIEADLNILKKYALNSFYKTIPIQKSIKSLKGIDFKEHASGYAFYANGIDYFNKFLDEVSIVYERKYEKNLDASAVELLDLMSEDSDLFYQRINLTNQSENLFYDQPIFNKVNFAEFSNKLCDLSKSDLYVILSALRKRYKLIMPDPVYPKEKQWIDEVVENIENKILPTSNRLKKAKIEQRILPIFKEIHDTACVGD